MQGMVKERVGLDVEEKNTANQPYILHSFGNYHKQEVGFLDSLNK